MNKEHLPPPDLDLHEYLSTLESIREWEAEGVDCTALKEYIKPLANGRFNLSYEQGKGISSE